MDKKYDFIILGSGLGGLLTAFILSKNGFSVCVLEKNPKFGGTLQSFKRFGCNFSTGMHYMGSLDEGQMLNRLFKYFGLFNNIEYKRLDQDAFEIINVAGKKFKYPIGWNNFKKQFIEYFPGNEDVFDKYLSLIHKTVNSQALYSLNEPDDDENGDSKLLMMGAYDVLKSLSPNTDIQNYLAALNFDYGGEKDKTPFYVHALVTNYFVTSSYRIIGDSDQLTNSLVDSISSFGGELFKRQKVVNFLFDNEQLTGLVTHTGNKYFANKFVSNIHPANTMNLIETGRIKKLYRNRMLKMKNTISPFSVNLKMKEGSFKYLNYNYQYFKKNDVWYASYYDENLWPQHFFLHTPLQTNNDVCADCIQLVTYMKYDEVKKWESTTKRTRGEEYQIWKREKAEKLIDLATEHFPNLRENIEDINISTPLSYRDYIGNSDGSMYGRISDFNSAVSNYISHKTKIPNLFLTGQNLNLHGMLGVSLSSIITSSEFVGLKNILKDINDA